MENYNTTILPNNNDIEILGPYGFSRFSGLRISFSETVTKLFFDDDTDLVATNDHIIYIDGKEVRINEVRVGDIINEKTVIDIKDDISQKVYDPINVELGDVYIANDIIHHNCSFLGSAATLISPDIIASTPISVPIYSSDGLVVYEHPVKGETISGEWKEKPGSYITVVDTASGVGNDSSAFVIVRIDILPYKVVARYKNNTVAPMFYPNIINKWSTEFNNAWILVEINKNEQVPHILQQELLYENMLFCTKTNKGQFLTGGFGGKSKTRNGVLTDKKVKRIGCSTLKTLVENRKLEICDAEIVSELSTFIERKGSFSADEGYHDDLVMCLALFAWATTQIFFKEMTDVDLRKSIFESRMREIEDEALPLVLSSTDTENEIEQWVDYFSG